MPAETCTACGSDRLTPFFDVADIPVLVCNLWKGPEEARACTRGDLELVFCEACGMIENRAFDPERVEYGGDYENSLHFSEFFQGYIQDFAQDVVERHGLAGKPDSSLLEIGCGDGGFLKTLVALTGGQGLGFDPSYPPGAPETLEGGRIRVFREPYGAGHEDVAIDLVVCRQVLEHLPDPRGFLEDIRRTLGERATPVVFEVPNALYTLKQLSLWDVIYEHRTYFSIGSLARLFAATGFDVTDTSETYERQFIAVDGKPGAGAIGAPIEPLAELKEAMEAFRGAWRERIETWHRDLDELAAAGKRVALWGTGARGVNFLNIADPRNTLQDVVDINPRKHGMHVAGTGQRIATPDSLKESRPDVVVLMNPIYKDEIQKSLREMGLDPELRMA